MLLIYEIYLFNTVLFNIYIYNKANKGILVLISTGEVYRKVR